MRHELSRRAPRLVTPLLTLAVCAVGTALSGCDGGDSPVGAPLVGFLSSTDNDVEVVNFVIDKDLTATDDCPTLRAGGVSFDGEVVDDPADGGRYDSWLTPSFCGGLGANVVVDGDAHDAAFVVESGGEVARYVGENLVAGRDLVLEGDATVVRGGTLRFRYGPGSDVAVPAFANLRDDPTQTPIDCAVRLDGDDVVVGIPTDAPTGAQTLNVRIDVEIATLTCEGFASCVVNGGVFKEIAIVIE